MDNLFGFETLDKILNRSFIDSSPKHCVRARHKQSKCSKCETICPVKAIELTPTPVVDKHRCIGCGFCENVCPTSALLLTDFPYRDLGTLLKEKKKIVYGCFISDNDGNVRAPCTGALNEGLLISSVTDHPALINHSKCKKCPYKAGSELITKKVQTLNRILELLGGRNRIEIMSEKPKGFERVITDDDERRDFIKQIGVEGLELIMRILPFKQTKPEKKLRLEEKIMPNKHVLLVNRILDYGAPSKPSVISSTDIELAMVSVNESCDGCEMCSTFCPSDALEMKKVVDENKALLEFDMIRCLSCDLCIDICPKSALSYEESLDISELFKEKKTLISLELGECTNCGESYIYALSGSELCPKCKKEDEIRKHLLNSVFKTNK